MATPTHQTRLDIGAFRKLRLNDKPNPGGYWEVWYSDADDGWKTKKHSTKHKDLVEATAYFHSFCADRRAETLVAAAASGRRPVVLVENLCQEWLGAVDPAKTRTGTYVLAQVRRHLGHHPADQLSQTVLRDYATQRRAAPGTIRRELGALRTVLIWAAEEDNIPLTKADIPGFKKAIPPMPVGRQKFLDVAQEARFWAEAQRWGAATTWAGRPYGHLEAGAARRVWLFVAIGLDTAARREAILDLTWDRVDFTTGLIDFRVPGKGNAYKRRVQVPIAKRLRPVLQEAWLGAPKDQSGHAIGRVVGGGEITKNFQRFAREIGMGWVTPHVMRHTWGSLRAMAGVPLYDVARGMGDTQATVERYYLHLTPDHLRAAFNA